MWLTGNRDVSEEASEGVPAVIFDVRFNPPNGLLVGLTTVCRDGKRALEGEFYQEVPAVYDSSNPASEELREIVNAMYSGNMPTHLDVNRMMGCRVLMDIGPGRGRYNRIVAVRPLPEKFIWPSGLLHGAGEVVTYRR